MSDARTVARILEIFRSGSGAPARAETASGEAIILKLRGAGGGERTLLTELIGLRIAAALGLRAPDAFPVWLANDFPWQAGTDEYDDMVRRSGGWNLAIAFIPDAEEIRGPALEALPDDFIRPLTIADMMLANVDRTAKNPNLLRDARGALWAIDFGGCLFLNRLLDGRADRPRTLPPTHFRASAPPPAPIALPAATVEHALADAPDAWFDGADRAALTARLVDYFASD